MKLTSLDFTSIWNDNGTIQIEKLEGESRFKVTRFFGRSRDYSYSYIVRANNNNLKEVNALIKEALREIREENKQRKLCHGMNFIIN